MDEQREREHMEQNLVARKVWTVPAHLDLGPATVEVLLPLVKVTDSEGRFIMITPRQSELVGARMSEVSDWLQVGDGDWVGDDE